MLRIGSLTLSTRCILAPMAGITDLPFRMMNRVFGCEFAFTEMISARAMLRQSTNTVKMLSTDPGDRPLGVQLLGNDPEILSEAAAKLEEYPCDLIDLNAACPVSKVTKKGEGAALLTDLRALGKIVRALVRSTRVPITVKIRSGWDEASVNAREVALLAQDEGASAVVVHGRTREQGYRGRVDYRIIGDVKALLTIPVIGSGDTFSPELIKKMLDETGCDGVAIARGALGNPWIFNSAAGYLASGSLLQRPRLAELAATMKRHLDLSCSYHGEKRGTLLFRKFYGWYVKGIPATKTLRERAFGAETKDEMIRIIEALLPGDTGARVFS